MSSSWPNWMRRGGEEEDEENMRKKKQGIFKTALVHTLSQQTAEFVRRQDDDDDDKVLNNDNANNNDNEKKGKVKNVNVSEMASRALVDYLLRGNDTTTNDNLIDQQHRRRPITRGGHAHDLLLGLVQSQRNWYLTGNPSSAANTTNNNNNNNNNNMNNKDIPAYPSLLRLTSDLVPSTGVVEALRPTVVWFPSSSKAQNAVGHALITSLPLTQNALDVLLKNSVQEQVLLDQSWRSWVKDSTTDFIFENQPKPPQQQRDDT